MPNAILDEVADVLKRKFRWPDEDVARIREQIGACTQTVTPAARLDIVKEDPDDDRILECAVSGDCNYIVTGDGHLLCLGRYETIRIVTVADFLAQQHEPD